MSDTNDSTIKKLLLAQCENLSLKSGYDFLYDDEEGTLLCQIIFRDNDGSILATPLSFHLIIDEYKGCGKVIYYHSKGEFHRQSFNIYETETLVNIFSFIQERLNYNARNNVEL